MRKARTHDGYRKTFKVKIFIATPMTTRNWKEPFEKNFFTLKGGKEENQNQRG